MTRRYCCIGGLVQIALGNHFFNQSRGRGLSIAARNCNQMTRKNLAGQFSFSNDWRFLGHEFLNQRHIIRDSRIFNDDIKSYVRLSIDRCTATYV